MALPVVLATVGYYLPGYRGGGQLRSLANIVDALGKEFQFHIVTRGHDLGNPTVFPDIILNAWNVCRKCDVYYVARLSLREWKHLLHGYDVLYLNSFFSFQFTIQPLLLRRFGMLPDKPVLIAPRGELAPGALAQKSLKKKVFHWLSSNIGLYEGVTWQASSCEEAEQIKQMMGKGVRVIIAPDLPVFEDATVKMSDVPRRSKVPGALSLVFVGRVARVKNLHGALTLLRKVSGGLNFSIYGPMEDELYWRECKVIADSLPPSIQVEYKGEVAHEKISDAMQQNHVLFLPSFGENFGHVILEAWLAAVPVLLSDRTPWHGLEALYAGWDLPLEFPDAFHGVLQKLTDMDAQEYERWSGGALRHGREIVHDPTNLERNRQMFLDVLGKGNRRCES